MTEPSADTGPPRVLVVVEAGRAAGAKLPAGLDGAAVTCVEGGPAALRVLLGLVDGPPLRLPQLIVIDVDPGPGGERRILPFVKEHPELRRIPVVVIAPAGDEADAARCYDLNANAYVPRPEDEEGLAMLARALTRFWLDAARLPD